MLPKYGSVMPFVLHIEFCFSFFDVCYLFCFLSSFIFIFFNLIPYYDSYFFIFNSLTNQILFLISSFNISFQFIFMLNLSPFYYYNLFCFGSFLLFFPPISSLNIFFIKTRVSKSNISWLQYFIGPFILLFLFYHSTFNFFKLVFVIFYSIFFSIWISQSYAHNRGANELTWFDSDVFFTFMPQHFLLRIMFCCFIFWVFLVRCQSQSCDQ